MKRYTPRKIVRIINELFDEGAVKVIYWDEKTRMPRVWLRRWCWPYHGCVSIKTAERVLDGIKMGFYTRPSETIPMVRYEKMVESYLID